MPNLKLSSLMFIQGHSMFYFIIFQTLRKFDHEQKDWKNMLFPNCHGNKVAKHVVTKLQ